MKQEQRLIDANKLDFRLPCGIDNDGEILVPIKDIIKAIAQAPTVDAVQIVRCKDCLFNCDGQCLHPENRTEKSIPEIGPKYKLYCLPNVKDEHFCSLGERKDGVDHEQGQ